MEIIISESPQDAGSIVADAIQRLLTSATQPVLGLSTGSSPLPVYRHLIDRHERGLISFPTLHDGREAALSWHLGEQEVMYWHEPEAGLEARESITTLRP